MKIPQLPQKLSVYLLTASLASLAACDQQSVPNPESDGTPPLEGTVPTGVSTSPDPALQTTTEPSITDAPAPAPDRKADKPATPLVLPAPTRAPAPTPETARTPTPSSPASPSETAPADPHAGHDMSEMTGDPG